MKYKDRVKASKEYGLFHFKVPSIEERNSAIDMSGEGTLFKKLILTDLNSFYKPISPPNINEKIDNNWLLSHKEYGQTYTEFIRTKSYYPYTSKNSKIYLVYLNFTKKVLVQKLIDENENTVQKLEKIEEKNENIIEEDNNEKYNKNNLESNPKNFEETHNYSEETKNIFGETKNIYEESQYISGESKNIYEESNNNINTNFINSKQSMSDNTLYNSTKKKFKKANVEEDFDMIINIPENLNENILNLILTMVQNYFLPMEIELINYNVPIGNLIFRKEDETDNLISVEADHLLTFLKKHNKLNNAYSIIYFTDIGLFHNISIYKEKQVNKYQFYPKSFLKNDSCFEMTNAKTRKCLISLSEFKVTESDNINNNDDDEIKQKKLESKSFKNYIKLILRNVALLFGLSNCIYYECLLNGFNSMEHFNKIPLEICPVCLKKIYGVILRKDQNIEEKIKIPNSIYERFKKLSEFLAFGEEKEIKKNNERTITRKNKKNKNKKKKEEKKEIDEEKEKEEREKKEEEKKKNIYAREFEKECLWYDKKLESLNNVDTFI